MEDILGEEDAREWNAFLKILKEKGHAEYHQIDHLMDKSINVIHPEETNQ